MQYFFLVCIFAFCMYICILVNIYNNFGDYLFIFVDKHLMLFVAFSIQRYAFILYLK